MCYIYLINMFKFFKSLIDQIKYTQIPLLWLIQNNLIMLIFWFSYVNHEYLDKLFTYSYTLHDIIKKTLDLILTILDIKIPKIP